MKVVMLSALSSDRLYPQMNIPVTQICYILCRSEEYKAHRRIMSIKYSNDNMRIRPASYRILAKFLKQTALHMNPREVLSWT
jgi:hypothetical protein